MRKSLAATMIPATVLAFQAAAQDNPITVDGSSTVFPISSAVAMELQANTGYGVIIGVSGTGGGFRKFCRGETDITGASRPINSEEIARCEESGIEFIELPVAMDGLAVIVNPDNDWASCMTVAELKTMWEVPAQGVVNNWNQVNAEFPDAPLRLFGAGADSGTYDYFTLAINGVEHESRSDYYGSEDDNITIEGVANDENALGFLGLAYLEANRDSVKAVAIRQPDGSCVAPAVESVRNGTYQPLSRPLFMYISKAALERPEVQAYADFMMDPAIGTALVAEVGYVPLPAHAFNLGKAKVAARKTGTAFEGAEIGVTIDDLLASE